MNPELQARLDLLTTRQARRNAGKQPGQNTRPIPRRTWGTVTAITTGPPRTVDVSSNGKTLPGLSPISSYLPAVGDYVMLDNMNGNVVVMGALSDVNLPAPMFPTRNYQTGNYTTVITDQYGVIIVMDKGTAGTLTIDDLAWHDLATIGVYVKGAGQITVQLVGGSSSVLHIPNGAKSAHQYAQMALMYDGVEDAWVVSGDTTT